MLLFDRNLLLAHRHLAAAIKRWPDEAALLLTDGALIETEASSREAYSSSSRTNGFGPQARSGGLVRDDLLSRERPARDAMLRDAANLFGRVLAIDSRSAEARIRLGHVRVLQKDDEHAAALFEPLQHLKRRRTRRSQASGRPIGRRS